MGLLAWLFTSMFLWTWEKNREARDLSGRAPDAPPAAAVQSPYERVLGVNRTEWEALGLGRQKEYLQDRLARFEALPESDPERRQTLPELYYWMATVTTRLGDGAGALGHLERAGIVRGAEDWYYLLRGAALEAKGDREEALDAYLTSFSHEPIPLLWEKARQFEEVGADELIRRTRQKLAGRSQPFEPFSLKTPAGEPRTLADFPGRVILVNFFFPSCPPCAVEFPHLQRLSDRYAGDGLRVVAINIQRDEEADVQPWLESKGFTVPALIGTDLSEVRPVYGVTGAPETFLLDGESGRSWFHHVGYTPGDEEQLEAEIRLMLNLPPFEEPAGS